VSRLVAADGAGFDAAVAALRSCLVVGFPTDTVFGVGSLATNGMARRALWSVKQRPASQPAILMVAQPWQLEPWAIVTDRARRLIAEFWPGPLTLVLEATDLARAQLGEVLANGTVAARVPGHPVALKLLEWASAPVVTSSANRAGEPPPNSAAEAVDALPEGVEIVLEGEAWLGAPSSILDLSRPEPRVLREGSIPAQRLLR
jgi:L-threonylcarbamoyladenylate synthase